jgi:hypothetical protein
MITDFLQLGDVRYALVEQAPALPAPVPEPEGTKTFAGDGRRFARVRGDEEMRDTGMDLQQTNMTRAMFYIKNGVVNFSKYIIRLDFRRVWVSEFQKDLGLVVWPLYCQQKFGWQDTNDVPTDPEIGPFKQQTIDSGLNLRELVGDPFWTSDGQYVEIAAVDFDSNPDPAISYQLTPHLMNKQVVVGKSAGQPVYYVAHQKHGDLVWKNLHTWPLIHAMRNLEEVPSLPHKTKYMGQDVTIEGYCHQGSKVYGYFNGGWYLIEEMVVSGIGSATYDRRVHVRDWIKTPPPPIRGTTRGKEVLEPWQLG